MPSSERSVSKKPLTDRLWYWLAATIPCGAGWMLDGRWSWQRRFGEWWLPRWGGAFYYYQKPWFKGPID